MNILLVAVGAAVGAPLRFLVDKHMVGRLLLGTRIETPLPWGTFAVNVLGSFVLGLLTGVGNQTIALLVGVGFCGAFTTYSTFAAETHGTGRVRASREGRAHVVLNLGAGLLAAVGGALLT